MLDISYFQNQNSNVQGFFNAGTWQTWIKPRGAKLVNIMCVGSGAGGGGGFQSATTPRGGGGGGGSAAVSKLTINANLLPDILYVLPGIGGNGGLGGTTATAGSPGQNSFICLTPDTSSISNIIIRSGNVVATGGGAGTTAAGTGSTGGTVNVIANNIFANLGIFTFQTGGISTSGATTSNAVSSSAQNFIGVAGGGGGSALGSGHVGAGVFPIMASTPLNTNGQHGMILYKPTFILYGGRGGGGSVTGNGGNGGDGAPGCGGGGGGASANTGVNAGNGGKGGDGFIIITTSL